MSADGGSVLLILLPEDPAQKKKKSGDGKNPTLLSLLKQGVKIRFPDDTALEGDARNGYIAVVDYFTGERRGHGVWDMSAEGLRSAQRDLQEIRREAKRRA